MSELSDAEPTDRDWLIEILGKVNGVDVQRPKQRQAIEQIYRREIDAIIEAGWETDESVALRDRMADLLTRTANALKGDPGPLKSHDWSDLPDVARAALVARVEAVCAASETWSGRALGYGVLTVEEVRAALKGASAKPIRNVEDH